MTPKPDSETRDNSLRAHALHRAVTGELPKTLTPWEWQEWYSEHGVPGEFLAEPNRLTGDTLYYDGQCPLCAREISWLQRLTRGGLSFCDIHSLEERDNLSKDRLLRSMHLQREDGEMVCGLDANIAMWQHTRIGWAWRLLDLPFIRPVANWCYELWARRRYRRLYQ